MKPCVHTCLQRAVALCPRPLSNPMLCGVTWPPAPWPFICPDAQMLLSWEAYITPLLGWALDSKGQTNHNFKSVYWHSNTTHCLSDTPTLLTQSGSLPLPSPLEQAVQWKQKRSGHFYDLTSPMEQGLRDYSEPVAGVGSWRLDSARQRYPVLKNRFTATPRAWAAV